MALENLVKSIPIDHEVKEVFMNVSSYDDIFSDFDTKPLTHRSLSDDFMQELKKECLDTSRKKVNITLIVPDNKRIQKLEIIIRRRIEEYLKKKFRKIDQERKKLIRTGLLLILIGAIILVTKYAAHSFFLKYKLEVLLVLLEPISWFLFWEGSYLAVFESKVNNKEYNFYKKAANAKISFKNSDY